jgi:hypothetical protein
MMKFTIDVPLDVFEALGTLAIREHRNTAQQAAYLLTRLMRDGQAQAQATTMAPGGGAREAPEAYQLVQEVARVID